MKRYFVITLIAALTGCDNSDSINGLGDKVDANTAAITELGPKLDALAPSPEPPPAAPVDPNSCNLPTGMAKTKVDDAGRVVSTPDALMKGEIAVFACDIATSPSDWRAWLVKGVKAGSAMNGQETLLVDSHGNALTVSALRGMASTSQKKVKGTYFTAACHDLTGDSTGCKVEKQEAPTSNSIITVSAPKGTKVVIVSGS